MGGRSGISIGSSSLINYQISPFITDGSGRFQPLLQYALNTNLDFFALTEHRMKAAPNGVQSTLASMMYKVAEAGGYGIKWAFADPKMAQHTASGVGLLYKKSLERFLSDEFLSLIHI